MKKSLVIFLCMVMLLSSVTGLSAAAETATKAPHSLGLDDVVIGDSYSAYLQEHADASAITQEQTIDAATYTSSEGSVEKKENYEGKSGTTVICGEDSTVNWTLNVPQGGFYQVMVEYYPVAGKGAAIERQVWINNELPFDGADTIIFRRVWAAESKIEADERGNDVRPLQVETPQWRETYITDSNGYYSDPYQFYFNEGENTFSLVAVKEPIAIRRIVFTQMEAPITYEELQKEYASLGYKPVDQSITIDPIQGENAAYTSASTLYASSDRTSPLTQPYDVSKLKLNMIGGDNWKMAGQWITWEVEVPESGLYEIGFKYRQNIVSGLTVVRGLKINDEYPCAEAKELEFFYRNDWQNLVVGGEEPYQFYLEKGKKNTITLEVAISEELGSILRRVEESVASLNQAYRELLVIIGSSPDAYRDYELDKKAPNALKILEEQYKELTQISKDLQKYAKSSKGINSSALDQLIYQTEMMYKDPDDIINNWGSFKDNIVALSSWSLTMREQPLEIDYVMVMAPGTEMPRADANFGEKLLHELRAFFASFFEDYTSLGTVYGNEAVTVWVSAATGRDQAQILKNMIDNDFTPNHSIPINLQLVDGGILMSATLAGMGPDVTLHVGGGDPVNYAMRNAVADLSQFPDFEEYTSKNFYDQALVPFAYEGGVYALPETMSFMLMFYRADILAELGLDIPQNWDQFNEAVSVIQKSNMDVGLPVSDAGSLMLGYTMFLTQNGGQLYKDDHTTSLLTEEVAIEAFQTYTGLFSDYKLPVTYDFANRFRTGEMPLAVQDYTAYNYLSVFAPEIKGLWGFSVVPGTVRDDGTINRTTTCSMSSCIMMEQSEQKENSWEFMKWWMSTPAQQEYCNSIENLLGVAGRVATANREAISLLPWTEKDLNVLKSQVESVVAIPEIAGGYFTSRHLNNAFYRVYNENDNPREVLEEYALTINEEITNKRKEFGLPIA